MKKYYIYQTTNLVNGKIYIGVHGSKNIDRDSYIGSGVTFLKAVKKYGRKNFIREILYEFNTDIEAYNLEHELVNEEFVERRDTYNMCQGGKQETYHGTYVRKILSEIGKKRTFSEETKKKISESLIHSKVFQDYIHSEEHRELCKTFHLGHKHTDEAKQKISIGNTGNVWSDEAKQKMSEQRKGIPKTEEFKETLSKKFKGRKNHWNEKTNKDPEKIRKTAEKHRGMKRTPETCKNISDSLKGKVMGEKSHLFTGYYITPFGKFSSSAKAAIACNISYTSVIDRCKGRNDCKVIKNTVTKDKNLTEADIGKTFKELGWSFESAERPQ
jgi:hypothetical protein